VEIGCLDGKVYRWVPEAGNEPTLLFSLSSGITCLKWENGPHSKKLAASSTDGTLAIVEQSPGESNNVTFISAFKAHKAPTGPQDLNFGSLGKFAEIWSIAWSPDNLKIATSSEDQTTHIWNLNGEKLNTLTGHTSAVTAVDWQSTIYGHIFATCADDKTVRIYDGASLDLLHIFTTTEVEEWHTITYLAIERGGHRVAVSTQSGYIFIWDIGKKQKHFGEKMHAGSIEGLIWNHKSSFLVSCGSDCNVNVYKTC